ncbi:DUF6493 family protein [Lentzea sp. NPDC003310]|uniref:DUF6493 family protein n=1 Tax=Lentzea sp. NPDC003310 TaxID=3154447 RepID=UPI00339E79ED
MTFDRIRDLIESDQKLTLGEVLKGLTPDERKACAKELVAYERKHRAEQRWSHGETLAIAGAGLLPTATALTPWLVRYRIWMHYRTEHDQGIEVLLDVLRHRDPAWMPDLLAKLAAKMPTRERWRQDLKTIIVAFCGDEPPDADGFLLHLMDSEALADWRPSFDALIPRMLAAVGSGAVLGVQRGSWPEFLRDRTDRQVLLDGCLARLQQGGSASEMDGFLVLHEVVKVTMDETAKHARDYVAMLPDSRSTVAGLAQEQLKWLDDAGRLDFALLADASRWVFGRTEKKLVRSQLSWLGKHAKAHPDEVVLTAAELFAHESADLRGHAVKLIVKHLGATAEGTRAEVRALAEQLPADLAQQLGVTAEQEHATELAPFEARPFPEPIATLDELTAELMSAFGRNAGHLAAPVTERIVEALVRFSWEDREKLSEAIQPLFDKHTWLAHREEHGDSEERTPRSEFIEVILATRRKRRPLPSHVNTELDFARNMKVRANDGAIAHRLARRLNEIAKGLVHLPKPALVSTPTAMSGLIDPAVLAGRLARAEAEGWQPWPRDLRQAFDRLPRDTDAGPFAALTGTAADQVREWLATRTDPVVTVEQRTFRYSSYYQHVTDTGFYAVVTPDLEQPHEQLRMYDEWGPMIEWWPTVLPARRELVAAHLVPHLRSRTQSKGGDGPLLPMLAEADGPAGPAVHLALGYGLGAELTVNRAYAVDAILVLAARDQLDGELLGDLLAKLLQHGDVVLNRVAPGLRDAARSGAAHQIWAALTALLPRLWTHGRVADLVELAVELAQQLRPGGDVEGLAEVAARKGTSKMIVQAKRLQNALGGAA